MNDVIDLEETEEVKETPVQEFVPFTNADTFITDLLRLANTVPDAQAIPFIAAAMMLSKAGTIMEDVRMFGHDTELLSLNLAPKMVDLSADLTDAWLGFGKIREKVWDHKTEQEVVGALTSILIEEPLEFLKAVCSEDHYASQFHELVEEIKKRAKELKTGVGVELDYTGMRDAIADTRVVIGNVTSYYPDLPQGEDLCEVMRSNMSKIVGDDGFDVDENFKIKKPAEFTPPVLRPWSPKK